MYTLYKKFIIEDGKVILGLVSYHKELTNDPSKVKGGGWYIIKDDEIIFYGDSYDFGEANEEDIISCIKSNNVYFHKKTDSVATKYIFKYKRVDDEIINLI